MYIECGWSLRPAFDLAGHLEGHTNLLLLAGGIGITAMHSYFRYLMQLAEAEQVPANLQHVRLVWTSRDAKMFEMFRATLNEVQKVTASSVQFSVELYSTGKTDHHFSIPVRSGRPSFEDVYKEMRPAEGGSLFVKLCAPEAMDVSAVKAARTFDWVTYDSHLFVM